MPVTVHKNTAAEPSLANGSTQEKPIIDIRHDREQHSLLEGISNGLQPKNGEEKRFPTLLLYDELGLKLFEQITYLEQYYPTNSEIEVLEKYASEIAARVEPGSILLELGSGNLRKVDILLKAIDKLGKNAEYYALDLSQRELERTLAEIPSGGYNHIRCFGLHGTYDDGLEWLQRPEIASKPVLVLWLGSSIGNLTRTEASTFLRDFARALKPSDQFLAGIDGCKDPDRVYHAYNDREGVTHSFIHNGLKNANNIAGKKIFDLDNWSVIGEFSKAHGRHQAFVVPTQDTTVLGIPVSKGEKIKFEESHKYDAEDITKLYQSAEVFEKQEWTNHRRDYGLHMLSKQSYTFPRDPEEYAPDPIPSWSEWTHLWKIWDTVTRQMISDEELMEKPIKLRNACIFYLGHIPTFFDMKLAEATDGVHTDPEYYVKIFERGIDPDVDNPEQCHAHSQVPDTWPPLEEILGYQQRVRDRVKRLYETGEAETERNVSRCLWLGYEHECMHLETLLYMLIQSDKTLPPPLAPKPDFEALARSAENAAVPNEWFKVPENEFTVGLDDPETKSGPKRYFGWDVEKPSRKVNVHAFEAKARPITIGEYAKFLHETGRSEIPASWNENTNANGQANGSVNGHTNGHANGATNGEKFASDIAPTSYLANKAVRSVYGPIPIAYTLHWPVTASYDELAACAAWMGGRIPSSEEAQSIYNHVERTTRKNLENFTQKTIPAVNSQMVNEGVEETPPARGTVSNGTTATVTNGNNGGCDATLERFRPRDIYADLSACNVGFQQWHPEPVTHKGGRLSGLGDMGGAWEWTSTSLFPPPGYKPMPLYPAFSQDFFDDKHNIVMGGSWATPPRLAGRKTFINWYQRNYPYVWATARIVRDL